MNQSKRGATTQALLALIITACAHGGSMRITDYWRVAEFSPVQVLDAISPRLTESCAHVEHVLAWDGVTAASCQSILL